MTGDVYLGKLLGIPFRLHWSWFLAVFLIGWTLSVNVFPRSLPEHGTAFSYADLKTLIEDNGRVCVSLFLPTHRAGEGTRQDPIRLKNLLGQAETRLAEAGVLTPDTARILQPAVDLVSDGLFWSHQSDGLAMFLAEGAFRDIDNESPGGVEDRLDTAAIQTVVRGGTVYAREPTRLPTEVPAAAILRD